MAGAASDLSARDRRTVRRILTVNHAGETAAIRIYAAQAAIARHRCPAIVADLDGMRADEARHAALFRDAMPARAARPCRALHIWSLGGTLLGAFTALIGEREIWICTEAVEDTVHRHLDAQPAFLHDRDADLHACILSIRQEEIDHLQHARQRIAGRTAADRVLDRLVRIATETVIWLSTRGDSSRLAADLAAARAR